jgi:peptide-methionine (S)-S-oxide reductase
VLRTRVGYAGGTLKDPTYHNLGDHTESMQIDFDPAKITYAQLLKVFCETHNPCRRAWSRQYMSIVFWHNEEQKKQVEEKLAAIAKENGKVYTEVLPYKEFYLAEDYHQKYLLQQNDMLTKEFKAMYPKHIDFVNSTAAAKVNGYLGGYASKEKVKTEIQSFGLSESAGKQLLNSIRND